MSNSSTDASGNYNEPKPDFKGPPTSTRKILIILGIVIFLIILVSILAFLFRKKEEKLFYSIFHGKNNTRDYDKACTNDKDCQSDRLICDNNSKVCKITPGYVCVDSKLDCANGISCLSQGETIKEKVCKTDGDTLGGLGSYSSEGICSSGLKLDTTDYKCKADIGTACHGGNSDCINKFCNAGVCSLFSPLQSCTDNSQCASNNCIKSICRSINNDTICPILGKSKCDCVNTCDSGLICNENICGPVGSTIMGCSTDNDCRGPTGSQSCSNDGVCINNLIGCNNSNKMCPIGYNCSTITNNCEKLGSVCNNNNQCSSNTCNSVTRDLFKFNNTSNAFELYISVGIPKEAVIINMISCNLGNIEYTFILYKNGLNDSVLQEIHGDGYSNPLIIPSIDGHIIDISISYNYLFIFTQLRLRPGAHELDDTIDHDLSTLYYKDLTNQMNPYNKVTLEIPRDYTWNPTTNGILCGLVGPNFVDHDHYCRKAFHSKNSLLSADVLFCKGAGYDFKIDKEYPHKYDLLETGLNNLAELTKNLFVVIVLLIKTPNAKYNDINGPGNFTGGNMLAFARVGLVNGDNIPFTAWQYRHDTENFAINHYRHTETIFSYNQKMGKYSKCKIIPPNTENIKGESSFTKPIAIMLYNKDSSPNTLTDPDTIYLHIKIQEKVPYTGDTNDAQDTNQLLAKTQAIKEISKNKSFINDNDKKVIFFEYNRLKDNYKSDINGHPIFDAYIRKYNTGKYDIVISYITPLFDAPSKTPWLSSVQINEYYKKTLSNINFGGEAPAISINYNNEILLLTNGKCI